MPQKNMYTYSDKENLKVWKRLNELADKRNIMVFIFPEKILKFLNGGESANGLCYFYKKNEQVVMIGENLQGRQRNEVLAHELGHAIRQGNSFDGNLYGSDDKYFSAVEKEADKFAVRLLKLIEKIQLRM